jgi:hypothetical protein
VRIAAIADFPCGECEHALGEHDLRSRPRCRVPVPICRACEPQNEGR